MGIIKNLKTREEMDAMTENLRKENPDCEIRQISAGYCGRHEDKVMAAIEALNMSHLVKPTKNHDPAQPDLFNRVLLQHIEGVVEQLGPGEMFGMAEGHICPLCVKEDHCGCGDKHQCTQGWIDAALHRQFETLQQTGQLTTKVQ